MFHKAKTLVLFGCFSLLFHSSMTSNDDGNNFHSNKKNQRKNLTHIHTHMNKSIWFSITHTQNLIVFSLLFRFNSITERIENVSNNNKEENMSINTICRLKTKQKLLITCISTDDRWLLWQKSMSNDICYHYSKFDMSIVKKHKQTQCKKKKIWQMN